MAIQVGKDKSYEEFGHKITENYREKQKLFCGTLKQPRQRKQYNMPNIKDKVENIITNEDYVMERWREYFEEV